MLTEEEKTNLSELLNGIPNLDLLTLARTCTNQLLKPENKEDAINAILLHSTSVEQILYRKRISKEFLFNYLHWKKIPTPANLDKLSLIKLLIDHWQNNAQNAILLQDNKSEMQPVAIDEPMANMLALQFSDWFYKLVNNESNNESLGHEHFWQDAQIIFYLSSSNNHLTEEAFGSVNVVNLIQQIKQTHNLYFYPNLCSDGVRGKAQRNGAVAVIACGTLHKIGQVLGTFEQLFLLIRDPLGNQNWKIKYSKVKLTSAENIVNLPVLDKNELGVLLSIETSEN
uniref:NTF2 domain-containing protein n=2 Tax=Clastoptera arizonana TaxID=38151 RepID=A0A1B6D7B7_9HEMI